MAQKKNKDDLIQFTFDDWRRGNVQGIIKLGKKISLVVYNKIKAAQKKACDKKVDFTLDHRKKDFRKLLEHSGNRKRLIDNKIEEIKRLWTQQIKPTIIVENHKNDRLRRYRAIYDERITNGKKDYSFIKVSSINEDDMMSYKKELEKLEDDIDKDIYYGKPITEEQVPIINRRIELLQEYISTGGIIQVDPRFQDDINVEVDVKFVEWLEEEKLKPEDPTNIKTLKDNLDAKEISKLFMMENSFYELVNALVKKNHFFINKEGEKWKITISDEINDKEIFLASMHFYLNEVKNSLTVHTYTHVAEIFIDFFNLDMTHNKFKERFKPKYKKGRARYYRYFTFMNTN